MKPQISVTQLAKSCVIMMFANKLLALPSILFNDSKYSSFFILISLLFIDFIVLLFILKFIKRHPKVNFFSYMQSKIGVILTRIVYFLFFAFFLMKLVFLLNESYAYLRTHIFDQAILPLFLLILLPVANSLAFSKDKALFRSIEFYYFFIMIAIIICVLLGAFSKVDSSPSPYFFDGNIKNFISQIFNKSMWFGDYLFLLFFTDKVENIKGSVKKIYIYLIFGVITLVSSYFIFYNLYQNVSQNHTSLISDLIVFTTNIGNVGKLNVIPLLIVMFIIFYQTAIFIKCSTICLDKLIYPSIFNKALINCLLIIAQFRFVTNIGTASRLMQTYFKYLGFVLIIILPLILRIYFLIIRRLGYAKSNKKNN